MQSTLKISGGLSVATNGLKVTGGLTINDLGATMPTLTLATNLGVKVTGGVTVPSNLYSAIAVTLAKGNLYVNGGCTLSDNLQIPESFVATDYTQAAGGVTVSAGGVIVGAGGLKVTGGVTNNGVLNVRNSLEVSGQMTVVTALSVPRLDPVTNGVTIVQDGLRIMNSGNSPSSLNITTTGLTVEGGITVWNSIHTQQHVRAADKVNVMAGGVHLKSSSQGRFKISDTNTIDVASLTVVNQGLIVSGGVTLYNTGLVVPNDLIVSGDITVPSTLHCESGMTVSSALAPINALKVSAGGLNTGTVITNQINVAGSGFIGDFYPESGIVVETSGGLTISAGGLVAKNGLDVTGNMLIYDNHLYLDDSLHIDTGYDLRVKKGNLALKNSANNAAPDIICTGLTATELSVYSGGLYVEGNVDIKMGSQRTGGTIKNNMLVGGAMSVNKEMIAGTACSVTSGGLKVELNNGDQGSGTNYANVQQSPELFVHGDIYFDDTTLEGTHAAPATRRTSDAQFKTQVKIVDGAMAMLDRIRGVSFSYAEDKFSRQSNDTTTSSISNDKSKSSIRLGVIAQEVQNAVPEAVSESNTKQGYLGVDYFKLVPVLIEALRELVDRLKLVEMMETQEKKDTQTKENNSSNGDTTTGKSQGQLLKVFEVLLKEEKDLVKEHDELTTRLDLLLMKISSL